MKKLHFMYQMSLMFSQPAHAHKYTLKCFPRTDQVQEIENIRVLLDPMSRNFVSDDSFGNQTLCGEVDQEHTLFQITVSGIAHTGLKPGREAREEELGKYKYASYYTKMGKNIQDYEARCMEAAPEDLKGEASGLSLAEYYMNCLYRDMVYTPGATGIGTKAEEAMELGRGVCQDYAHILLALLRNRHIPCRYVVGMMIGEGASHAWVEVADHGIWYGVDPTNGRLVDDQYIFISCGRDAFDCQMNKGVMTGGGMQRQSVSVIVTEQEA